jgi:MFS family permease
MPRRRLVLHQADDPEDLAGGGPWLAQARRIPAYIAEFAPRERRGQLSIIQQWMITVGILVSYLVAVVVLLALPHDAGNLDWRLFLGVGAIPAILALALRSKMPESPRWLGQSGRRTGALVWLVLGWRVVSARVA